MAIESKLTRFDLTMVIVSFVIGVGIFKTPSIVADKAGTPFIFYAAWIIGGIISICGALTFAEIGSRMPAAGGYYKIFSHCYHPAFAFMLNWALVIINAGSSVAVAKVGAEYIKPVIIPEQYFNSFPDWIIALFCLTILFGFNYAGIKMGSRVQNILSGLKIAMVLLLCIGIFGKNNTPDSTTFNFQLSTFNSKGGMIAALGFCLIKVFFTFGGYQNTINLGADVKNPHRNIPLAIISGMAIIICLYLLINVAYVKVLGFDVLRKERLPAAALAGSFFGIYGYKVISVIVFTSCLGFLNSSFMHNPRIYYAMAEDGILPYLFKKVNSKTQTQEFALTFFFVLSVISLFLLKDFDKIVNYVMFIDSMALAFAAISVFILRAKMKNEDYTGYKVRLYPLVPVIFILVLFWVTYCVIISDIYSAGIGVIILIAGFPLYHLLKKLK
jgi:APA family basic amino acid/polyamine antiporter